MKFHFNVVAVLVALLVIQGCAATVTPPPAVAIPPREAAIERWADNHPEAASDLGNWVKNHPQAARKFFEWDSTHPDRSKLFVIWAITHPVEEIDVFVEQHHGWQYFDEIMERHRPAAQTFIAWCRKHPRAAEALMNHPGGLQWAGNHLYRAYWEMKAT
jgi:hypothetical protein